MDTQPQEHPLVGDDGELLQADPTTNPIKYAEYVEQSTPPPVPNAPIDRMMSLIWRGCLLLLVALCGLIIVAAQTYKFVDNPNASPPQGAPQPKSPDVVYQTDLVSPLKLPQKSGQIIAIDLGVKLKAARWSPDGTRIATLDETDSLRIWRLVDSLTLPDAALNADLFDWSPDGKQLITSYGGSIAILDAATGATLKTFHSLPASDPSKLLDLSPDGRQLALVTKSNTLWVINVETGDVTDRENFPFSVSTLEWSPDGKTLMTVFNSIVWYWQDGNLDRQELQYNMYWYSVGWASDGEHLALVGERLPFDRGMPIIARYAVSPRADHKVSLQELWSSMFFWTSGDSFGTGVQAKWSPDSKIILVFASGGRTLYRFDGGMTAGIFSAYAEPLQDTLTSAEWSPDSRYIAFSSGSTLALWLPSPMPQS